VLYRPCVKVNVMTTCDDCTLEYGLEVRSVTTRPTDQQSSLTPGNTTRNSTSRVLNSRLVLIIMGRYNESGDYLGVEERNKIPALVAFARAIYLLFSNPNLRLKFPNLFHVSHIHHRTFLSLRYRLPYTPSSHGLTALATVGRDSP